MRRRRRPPPRAHSISCTDAEWERVRVLSGRRGLSISRHMVECGLTVDPETEPAPPPRLVLDEAEQRRLHDSIVRIAERTAAAGTEEEVLTRIRNALAFLVDRTMRTMARDGHEEELRGLSTDLFGEQAAVATVEQLRARMNEDGPDS